ncbi:hypothetical protein EMIHUDRAFT_440253, partial [Emiliania huxleyi CCMP1516]|uniref:Uncharacterized protein n=2 Tax=Emiliania huxleyi TaxID=2903 RepID=A0A0D3KPU9_EMIH1
RSLSLHEPPAVAARCRDVDVRVCARRRAVQCRRASNSCSRRLPPGLAGRGGEEGGEEACQARGAEEEGGEEAYQARGTQEGCEESKRRLNERHKWRRTVQTASRPDRGHPRRVRSRACADWRHRCVAAAGAEAVRRLPRRRLWRGPDVLDPLRRQGGARSLAPTYVGAAGPWDTHPPTVASSRALSGSLYSRPLV